MTKPTRPQLKYLENALKVCDAGTGRFNFFWQHGPGRKQTGRICLSNGWIMRHLGPVYSLTPAGRAVLEEQS